MKKTQKVIAALAMAMFVATLIWSPWEEVHPATSGSLALGQIGRLPERHRYEFAPIWSGPPEYPYSGSPQINLRYGVLATWWLAIGVLYAGGLMAMGKSGISKQTAS